MSDAAAPDAALLVRRLREQRRHWVQLDGRRAVRFSRPTLEQRVRMASQQGAERIRAVLALVDAWRGFELADVEPTAEPGGGELPFDGELWAELVDERDDWIGAVVEAVASARAAAEPRIEGQAGN